MTGLDPRLRLALAVALISLAGAAPRPWAAIAVAVVAIAAVVRRGGPVRRLVAAPLLLGAVTAAAVVASRSGPEAAGRGGLVAARAFAGGAVGAWLGATLSIPALLGALASARCPRALLELLALTARQTSALASAAASVREAQRARLGDLGFRRRVRAAGLLAGAVAGRALDRAAVLSDVLAIRGEPPIDPIPPSRLPRGSRAALWACALVALGGCALLGWGTPW